MTAIVLGSDTVRGQVPVKRVKEFIRLDGPWEVAQSITIQIWDVLKDTSVYIIDRNDLVEDSNATS